ncbi:response regulator [Allocoleopsis sp.]|uniref:response regulator n=1 Tax=Allocoleopsis sp. TaxID=3088169 RepID=UPI002FD253B9
MILTRLTQELDNLSQSNDGELVLSNAPIVWNLHLVRGKLLYALDEFHPVRRWSRALKQHCPNWNWTVESSQLTDNQSWQCQLLTQGFVQKQLSLIQAKLVIRTLVQECLFELGSYTELNSDWKPNPKTISVFYQTVALSNKEIQSVLNNAVQMQQKWQAAGLAPFRPTLAPTLRQEANSLTLPISEQYLNGQFTLWDIALQLQQSVTEVTCSLIPLLEKGILQFQEIPDLPVPTIKQPVAEIPPPVATKRIELTQKESLIACIEDSPVLAYTLKKILTPAGYQVLTILEPMRGFSQLIEHKPDLILLDLHLPNADGYSICKFLRETPVFKNTPIIILTAKNTQIDRFRAKQVGATEFLGKPPQPKELLQMVEKYLVQSSHLVSVNSEQ